MPAGRPDGTTKIEFNRQLIDEWRSFGRLALKFSVIAKIKCVSPSAITRYNEAHPELLAAYEEGLGNCENELKAKAVELAKNGNLDALKYVVKHISDWKDKSHLESEHTERKVILLRDARAVRDLEQLQR